MRITELHIYHFKSIREIHLTEIENVLILVGQNSSGKTCILDAIRAVMGNYVIAPEDFNEKRQKIEIEAEIELDEESLQSLHARKIVSGYKRYEKWLADFGNKLPSWKDGRLRFTFQASPDGDIRYFDGVHKNNRYICQLLPEVFYLDSQRDIRQIQETILMFQEDDLLKRMRTGCCMFDSGKPCSHCFSCMGLIERKRPDEMNAFEAEKLLEYKLYQMNLDGFSRRVNRIFRRNSGRQEEICYELQCHANQIFQVETTVYNPNREYGMAVDQMGKGMRSIYILSLLEECGCDDDRDILSILRILAHYTFRVIGDAYVVRRYFSDLFYNVLTQAVVFHGKDQFLNKLEWDPEAVFLPYCIRTEEECNEMMDKVMFP